MSGNSDSKPFQGEFKHAVYATGMEDAVVDLVVIQWIMQKLKRDRKKRLTSEYGTCYGDSARSA